ncbi:MAG: peptidoglycan DD-metalloendopeptidase family protein [Saprospiraceae bacterium]|nr:peptidoglycan DD-metalloendopeptidase family protein [Saprospiraceae bacterium]
MRFFKIHILIVVFLLAYSAVSSQSRKELEKQRMEIIKEIEKTSKILDNTKKNKEQNLSRLKALEEQIESRKKLLNTLQQEIAVSESSLASNLQKLDSLHQKEIALKEQYKSVLRTSYLRKVSNSSWSYLLSSDNLNRLFYRWVYLRQFENFAAAKAEEIKQLTQNIESKNESIRKIKEERQQMKQQTESNMAALTKEQSEKDALIKKLSKEEQNLNAKLAKSQKERENLNAAIEKIIIAELAKSRDAEKAAPEAKKKAEVDNSDFAKNKGNLPWPVSKGTITGQFGTHPHPTIKSLEVSNNGIDITLTGGDDVKCIFDGEVVGVTNIPGFKNMVIIRHGNYYTVYSKMDQAAVSKGQSLKRGQIIGKVIADESGKSELHFELWKDKSKLNPAAWISKN